MSIVLQGNGALGYSTAYGLSVKAAYPGVADAGDLLVLVLGQHTAIPNVSNVVTPFGGWTPVASLNGANDGNTGGYGTVGGPNQGNCNIYSWSKVAVGGETGNVTVALGQNNGVAWAIMYRFSNATGLWSVVGVAGKDVVGGGDVSIALGSDPGVDAGDHAIVAMAIPSNVAAFAAEALAQAGVTFDTVYETAEAASALAVHVGGFLATAAVTAGPSTAAPVLTATAAGTTTNVRGPGLFIRLREAA